VPRPARFHWRRATHAKEARVSDRCRPPPATM
jgi:hypothetical protein